MKIHLKQGIDKLRFGMKPVEVEGLFGKPNREFVDSDDDNDLIWEYTERNIRLTFYKNEALRLGYIRSSNPALTLNDSRIIDEKIEVLKLQIDSKPEAWELEDYDTFTSYFLESKWLILNVEYERVSDLELGVPINNKGDYDWPIKLTTKRALIDKAQYGSA